MEDVLVQTLEAERHRIWCWMLKLTSAPDAADDIVQETYTIAWQKRYQIIDDTMLNKWLNAIAYNVYKRWRSAFGRNHYRQLPLSDTLIGSDSEFDLERHELHELLDQALDQLPPELRSLLIARYIQQRSTKELAESLNISENALSVRMHRGKLALRQIIENFQHERGSDWQQSRIWCGHCGQAQYEGKLDSATGELVLICPRCNPDPKIPSWEHSEYAGMPDSQLLGGLHSLQSAITRLKKWVDAEVRPALAGRLKSCSGCGRMIPLHRTMPDFVNQPQLGVHTNCPYCGTVNYIALNGIAASTPQARQFAHEHPRHHILPARQLHHSGQDVLQIRIESLRSAGTLDVLFSQATYEVIQIYRNEQPDDRQ